MPVNWQMGGGNNALANFGYGVQLGQNMVDRREEREQRNALLDLRRQQEARMQSQEQREARQAQQADRKADLPMLGRLLDYATDEQRYQQAMGVAQQYGIDTSGLPQAYDPNWVAQQREMVKRLSTPQGEEALSNAGKQAMDMGFSPGTPEFAQATRQLVEASLAQPYMGQDGETRLYTPQIGAMPGGAPQQPQGQPQGQTVTVQQFANAMQGMPPATAAGLAQRAGMVVRVTTPQEAESLPSGVQILLPDGTIGVVP